MSIQPTTENAFRLEAVRRYNNLPDPGAVLYRHLNRNIRALRYFVFAYFIAATTTGVFVAQYTFLPVYIAVAICNIGYALWQLFACMSERRKLEADHNLTDYYPITRPLSMGLPWFEK